MSNIGKALIVSDDAGIRRQMEQAFHAKTCAVTIVTDAEQAIWKLSQNRYDIVCSDHRLRGMTGVELADEIGSRHGSLPVIVFVPDGVPSEAQYPASDSIAFLPRPPSSEQLADAVDRMLAAPRAENAAPGSPEAVKRPRRFAARLRNIVIFLFAPVFAVGYMLALPVVWLGLLTWSAVNARDASREAVAAAPDAAAPPPGIPGTLLMMLVALLVGIGFAILAPLLGAGALVAFGLQAWVRLGTRTWGSGEA